MKKFRYILSILCMVLMGLILSGCRSGVKTPQKSSLPDLTRTVIRDTEKDFHLGPVGARGWMHVVNGWMTPQDMSAMFSTAFARQILVTSVEKGSPSDGVLAPGDVILGIGNKPFSKDPRVVLGNAINDSEKEENKGILKLLRWRPNEPDKSDSEERSSGRTETVSLQLKVLGTFSKTAPYDCPKSEAILKDTVEAMSRDGLKNRMGVSALALLATGEKKHIEQAKLYIKKIGGSDLKLSVEKEQGTNSWGWSYRCIILAEYYLLTGDDSVLPAIREYTVAIAKGQSNTGDWGHKMAGYDINKGRKHGRLRGYGSLSNVSLTCYMAIVLGKKCGVEHPELDLALKRSADNFGYYIDRGGVAYGYGSPMEYILTNNGMGATAALIFAFQGNKPGAKFFSKLCGASAYRIEIGHTGTYFNTMWTALGAAVGGPELCADYFKRWRWLQTLSRRWNGGFVYQTPGGGKGGYRGLDPSAANLLHLCLPRRKLMITGKDADESIWLRGEAAEAIAGCEEIDYKGANGDKLIQLLGHELPIVQMRAAETLAKRDGNFCPQLIDLLDGTRKQKIGACHTLRRLKEKSAPAVEKLMALIRNNGEDDWVRNCALNVLIRVGEPAQSNVDELMRILIDYKPKDHRRALEVTMGKTILKLSPKPCVEKLDKKLLYPVVMKLLDHPQTKARSMGMDLIKDLPKEDFYIFADKIAHVIRNKDVNYTTYIGDSPRASGLAILDRLNIAEGLDLSIESIDPDLWGKSRRFPGKRGRFEQIRKYGANAKPFIPEIKAMNLGKGGDELIRDIEASKKTRKLISIKDAKKIGKK